MNARQTMLLAALLAAARMAAGPASAEDAGPIKIGISQLASGTYGDYWLKQVIKPAQLAVDDANAKGGVMGSKVEAIVEDNRGDASLGASVAHKLVDIDRVDLIFVAPTPPALATIPIAEASETLMVSEAQSPKLAQSAWGSSASPPAQKMGAAYARFAVGKKAKQVAIIAEDNDSVATSLAVLRAQLKEAGIPLVDSESYKGGTQDFSAQLTKIRAANPDLLMMMSSSGPTFGYILKQMAELNFRPATILTYVQVTDPQARQVAGDLVNGVYYIRLPVDPEWNARVFKPRTGYDADLNGAISYDAIALYLAARATVLGGGKEAIRDAMFNFEGYKGALGAWSYEGTHVTHVDFEAAQLLADGSSVKVPF